MNRKYVAPEIKGGVKVLGIKFQAFVGPTQQVIFSQSGAARGLKIPRKTVGDILSSEKFKIRGNNSPMAKVLTTINSQPISALTQTDLVLLVQIAAEKGYSVARSMQEASFAILLQQSVDEALEVSRSRQEYLEAGATLRERLEYRYSYHSMKNSTFIKGYGVAGLCKINSQVSSLAVPDAQQRRRFNKAWRKNCTSVETVKITIGNTVHQKAVEASTKQTLDNNLSIASDRTSHIYELLDAPF